MKEILEKMSAVLDRLANGETFNDVVEDTGITTLVSQTLSGKIVAAEERDRELLQYAASALRDIRAGCAPKDLASPGNGGLDDLLVQTVTHLRSQGVDDEGGWDCDITREIPVLNIPAQAPSSGPSF
jgi:hypothetical protein